MATIDGDEDWFPFGAGAFIEAARRHARLRLAGLVRPSDTAAQPWGLVVYLRAMPHPRFLVVSDSLLVWEDDDAGQLMGGWGTPDPSDHDAADPEAVVIASLEMGDAERGERAVRWVGDQLGRPIECRRWARCGATYRQWVLADTGTEVSQRGSRRLTGAARRAPDDVAAWVWTV